MMKLAEALQAAPPTPACFPDRLQWAAYLLHCQQMGKRAPARPFDDRGIYKPSFSFCSDCTQDHAWAMREAGKCSPQMFIVAMPERKTCTSA